MAKKVLRMLLIVLAVIVIVFLAGDILAPNDAKRVTAMILDFITTLE
ncbi:MAG: hypothetical protein GY803_02760 [Chloroflexi bacterium]|nr:hypothetical protein [Chloroflexota bacterium]